MPGPGTRARPGGWETLPRGQWGRPKNVTADKNLSLPN